MDLQLYSRVIWRFRLLVAAGLVVAAALALAAVMRISPTDGLSYREPEHWSSTTRLLITQGGFPWGRAVPEEVDATQEARELGIRFASPDRFVSLAVLYAHLVASDPVREVMLRGGPIPGRVTAGPVFTQQQYGLPLVDVVAIATDKATALTLGRRATAAIRTYIREQQNAYGVPAENRVVVQVLQRPKKVELFDGRSKTLPIVVFLTVLIATLGLAFILENLRPRIGPIPDRSEAGLAGATRRSA